jgi:hypothetical protein
MSKLAEILRTLRDDETVVFSPRGLVDGIRIVAYKDSDKSTGPCRVSRVVAHLVMDLSIIEEPEAIELKDMLTKLREYAEGKTDADNANS